MPTANLMATAKRVKDYCLTDREDRSDSYRDRRRETEVEVGIGRDL